MPLHYRSTFGIATAPGANFNTSGPNNDNEVANPAVDPPLAGYVINIGVHFGGNGATVTARNVCWDSSGNIVAKTPQFTAPAAPALQTLSPAAPGVCRNGVGGYQVGFWYNPPGNGKWFVLASGTFNFKTDLSGDAGAFTAPTACAGPFICDNIEAFVTVVGSLTQRNNHLTDISFKTKRRF